MDAVGVIKENMNVERILNHYGADFPYYGQFIRSACPIHKGDKPTALGVNEEFLWACQTNSECGVGDVFTFVEKMEDVSVPQAVKRKMDEEMERDDRIDSLFDKTKDELYEQLSEEDKKEVDEFEKELNKCNTLEEALILTLNKLKEK